ncbi:hypothetical protein [Clostridium neonatale]|uniref:hypothetical protein n=1 Tax=Clostridium neonatale TaxID=137838 RepID=UPI00291BC4A5|nr:membrane hypothetical protein [Clostridium neonatale]
MKKVNKIQFGIILSVFIVTLLYILWGNLINNYGQFYISRYIYWFLVFTMAYMLYLSTQSKERIRIIIILFLFFSVIIILMTYRYSPIDEAAHFDYINYIIDNHKLPTLHGSLDADTLSSVFTQNIPGNVMNHEAVQPPLYYLIMAMLTFWVKNYTLRLYIIRFLGILSLIVAYLLTCKTIKLLEENKFLEISNTKLNIIFFLVIFNPGTIIRMSYISNEHLAVLLSCIFIYLIVKLIIYGVYGKLFWKSCLTLILLMLTKNTTIFLLGILIIVLIYYKKIKEIFLCVGIIGLSLTPWFIFNIVNYGKLTGMSEHVKFVIQIVNPQNMPIEIPESIASVFNTYFVQEYGLDGIGVMLLHSLSLFLLFICVKTSICAIKNIIIILKNNFKFTYDIEERKMIINIIMIMSIVFNILVLVMGSISTKVNVIIGRYLYISFIPLVYVILIYINKWKTRYIKYVCILISLFLSISYLSTFVYIFDSNQGLLGIFAPKVEVIKINDSEKIASYSDVKIKEVEDFVEIESGNIDPQIVINTGAENEVSKVALVYDSENNGEIQLFYKAKDQEFSEENSSKMNIRQGENNKVYFNVNNKFKINDIRIDPSNNSLIKVKKIELLK